MGPSERVGKKDETVHSGRSQGFDYLGMGGNGDQTPLLMDGMDSAQQGTQAHRINASDTDEVQQDGALTDGVGKLSL